MSARDVISSRDYAALSEAVRDALDRCAGGFDRYHADHAVDAVLDGLDHLGYAAVKLPQPEPSPDGDGVMFHGRGSAMVIFVDDDGRICDRDVIAAFIARAVDWDGDDLGKAVFTSQAEELVAALRESRTVRTVEQLDALPEGTLIAHGGYVLRNRDFCGWWRQVQRLDGGLCDGYDVDQNHIALPALILWHPKDGAL